MMTKTRIIHKKDSFNNLNYFRRKFSKLQSIEKEESNLKNSEVKFSISRVVRRKSSSNERESKLQYIYMCVFNINA